MTDRPPHIIGMMTGTSLDAVDAALVAINGTGFTMKPRLVGTRSVPLGPLADDLRRLADGQPMTARDIALLRDEFSDLHAQVVQDLRSFHDIHLVVVHGQTILHEPPLSWQLINPARIAIPTQTSVLSDLRAADLAAGGQGAPITPLADAILFGDEKLSTAVINLGGFCNITVIPPGIRRMENIHAIQGFDCCACNHILNTIAQHKLNWPYDKNGLSALKGIRDPDATSELTSALIAQRNQNRSLGSGDELTDLSTSLSQSTRSPSDLLRSACAAIAMTIADTLRQYKPDRLILAGGSAMNAALVEEIANHNPAGKMSTTDDFSIPVSHREAVCMAILGQLALDGIPITLPQVTHVPSPPPKSGTWTHP